MRDTSPLLGVKWAHSRPLLGRDKAHPRLSRHRRQRDPGDRLLPTSPTSWATRVKLSGKPGRLQVGMARERGWGCGPRAQGHPRAGTEQRLRGAGGLRGTVLEVVVAVGAQAGERAHVLQKVHLAVPVGVQEAHELLVVALPGLGLQGAEARSRGAG